MIKFDRSTLKYSNKINIETNYLAGDNLVEAVNIAILLGMPLLLQGEPGCGKTALAEDIAKKLELKIEKFHVKSTSKAQDLLYNYDAISRLYDSELGENGTKIDKTLKFNDINNYITYTALGKIIKNLSENKKNAKPCVLLIDEIDKADMDFSNDLLLELDEFSFKVKETDTLPYKIPDENLKPIVIITHNEEKSLSTPFLRRCIYHYVEFPEKNLNEILKIKKKDYDFNKDAIEKILEIRKIPDLEKKPSLKELIDWVEYLGKVENKEYIKNEVKSPNKSLPIISKTKNDNDNIKKTKNEQ